MGRTLMMKRILAQVLLLLLFSIDSQAGLQECFNFFKPHSDVEVHKTIRWNLFVTGRRLQEYYHHLPKDFIQTLQALKATDTWIDLGAGKGFAAEDYFASKPYLQFAANVVLVTYKLDRFFGIRKYDGKLRVLEGKLWEDIPASEIPKAKLMTDVFGVLSYSRDLSSTLKKIFEHLEKDGELYVFGTPYLTVIEKNGKVINLESFLKEITGLQVEGRHGGLKITKTSEEIVIPKMQLIQIDETQKPFFRRFRVLD